MGGTANFGQASGTIRPDPDLERESNWEYGVSVQHELVERMAVTMGYHRRTFSNLALTDNLNLGVADWTLFTITAPLDARLPGGGYPIEMFTLNPAKVGAPSESTEEVEKTFKKVDETTITARGTITVSTTDGLGDVIAALIKADLKFTTPRFTYPTITDLEPEHYEKVAAQARAKAEAAARGSGCSLGRILEIDFPNPLAIEKPKNLRDFWSGRDFVKPNLLFNLVSTNARDTYVPDSSLFDVLNTNVPTYSDEFKVTIKFEIVSG